AIKGSACPSSHILTYNGALTPNSLSADGMSASYKFRSNVFPAIPLISNGKVTYSSCSFEVRSGGRGTPAPAGSYLLDPKGRISPAGIKRFIEFWTYPEINRIVEKYGLEVNGFNIIFPIVKE